MPIQQMLLGAGAGGGPDLDDVFSIDTYTGNESNRSITTGLNMSGLGGFTWIKVYESGVNSKEHMLFNTAMGANKFIQISDPNASNGVITNNKTLTSFNSDGFSLGTDNSGTKSGHVNHSGSDTVAYSFVNQDKFFKLVTWTGNGNTDGQVITHGLGSTPGFIACRSMSTSSGRDFVCFHDKTNNSNYLRLNKTHSRMSYPNWAVGSTTFTARHSITDTASLNTNGEEYFALVFGDESGGGSFGSTGDKKGIVVGDYNGNNSSNGPTVNLGFKPGFLIVKRGTDQQYSGKWFVYDHVRGLNYPTSGNNNSLELPNDSPQSGMNGFNITDTGFQVNTWSDTWNTAGKQYVYIAMPIST